MLRARPLLDLLPCAARSRMLKESLFAATQFVALRVGNRQPGVLLGDAIPKVFNELDPFSSAQTKKRREFSVHAHSIRICRNPSRTPPDENKIRKRRSAMGFRHSYFVISPSVPSFHEGQDGPQWVAHTCFNL
jgi:hypothetical protein